MINFSDIIEHLGNDAITLLNDNIDEMYTLVDPNRIQKTFIVEGKADCPVIESSLKRFDIECHLTAKQKSKSYDEFKAEILVPAVFHLAFGINQLAGEYHFFRETVEHRPTHIDGVASINEGDGMQIITSVGYNMRYMVTTLCVSTTLIKQDNCY